MRSKRYSNHPTITVLVQGVYASVFVQGTKDNQSSSVHSPSWARVFRAAFRTRAQMPLRIEPVHRSGMYAIERRWQTRLVVEQQQNETKPTTSCSPVLLFSTHETHESAHPAGIPIAQISRRSNGGRPGGSGRGGGGRCCAAGAVRDVCRRQGSEEVSQGVEGAANGRARIGTDQRLH